MPASGRDARARIAIASLVAVAIALKLLLLATSQSMADGDEAVTGLMAKHVVERGAHPIYPWGVRYGAGAGVEAHLAALLFAAFGVSDVALKGAGLLVWIATLALVGTTASRMAGAWAGGAAALLYAFAPSGAEWSMKVAGGHGVGVLLALAAVAAIERGVARPWIALLLPLAAIAHPIVAPFCAALALFLLWRSESARERGLVLAALLGAGVAVGLALRPPASGVWDPSARALEAGALVAALPAVIAGLFAPNLNARSLPALPHLVVSIAWLAALVAAALRARSRGRLALYLGAPALVLLAVRAGELAPRHLLLLYPLGCIALAVGFAGLRRRNALVGALCAAGAAVQLHVAFDPAIHGPDPQDRGVLRANVAEVLAALDARGVRHVYCLDPMFQWNLAWASRERVVARWVDPVDRVPAHPASVDAARLAGLPVAVVARPQADSLRFEVFAPPPDAQLEAVFPRAPEQTP
jgi:hypothetical protein